MFADIDECRYDNGECQHICENKPGNYVCHCLPGYDIILDGKSCIGNVHTYLSYRKVRFAYAVAICLPCTLGKQT